MELEFVLLALAKLLRPGFKGEFIPFSNYELEVINPLIEANKDNDDGKELMTAVLLTKCLCNIMNKYKK